MEDTSEKWYSDGTTKVYRYTLRKDGFTDLNLRKILGVWQIQTHKYINGDVKWSDINLEQFPEEKIIQQIEEFGVEV